MGFLLRVDLQFLKKFGDDVKISDKCSIYGGQNIEIGNNVRIDDFCILSASKSIRIGDNVHIACHTIIMGQEDIVIRDCVDISMRNTILSSTSDPSGNYFTAPVMPANFLNTISKPVLIERYSVIYAGSLILPGSILRQGAAIGAMSMVKGEIPSFEVWAGVPARFIRTRDKGLLNFIVK